MTEFYRGRAWIELSQTALRHNVEQLQALLPPNCALMPAVKANAYGHGAVLIAKELNTLGVNAFCVATFFEGIELRQGGVAGEILILGYTHPQYVPLLVQYHLTQTVLDYPYALELNACGRSSMSTSNWTPGCTGWGNAAKIWKIFSGYSLANFFTSQEFIPIYMRMILPCRQTKKPP